VPPQQLNPAETISPDERRVQRVLLESHKQAGNLTPQTAARYREDLDTRGISIIGRPMDGPNAEKCLKRWQEMERALQQAVRTSVCTCARGQRSRSGSRSCPSKQKRSQDCDQGSSPR
jgi:hypothetical protein